jgi:hypothetical protein
MPQLQGLVSAANCVMIGDRPKDVKMANDAGIPCLLVDHDGLVEAEAAKQDGILRGFKGFQPALKKIGFEIGGRLSKRPTWKKGRALTETDEENADNHLYKGSLVADKAREIFLAF